MCGRVSQGLLIVLDSPVCYRVVLRKMLVNAMTAGS